jgi:predicted dehydrogenase
MIRIGIVGIGYLGRIHLAVLQELAAQFQIVGVFDRNPIVLNDSTNATQELIIFNTYQELLHSVDAVAIIASTPAHFQLAREAILAGKAVFVEKPMCATLQEARLLYALAQQQQCFVQVGHVERFNPAIVAASSFLEAQKCLTFEAIRTAPFQPRGTEVSVVLDLMIHDLDLLLTQTTSPVATIAVEARCEQSLYPDEVQAKLKFTDGLEATIFSSRIAVQKQRSIRIHSPQHLLALDLLEKLVSVQHISNLETQAIHVEQSNSLQVQWLEFAAAYHAGCAPQVGVEAGLRALELAFEIEARAIAQIAQNSKPLHNNND